MNTVQILQDGVDEKWAEICQIEKAIEVLGYYPDLVAFLNQRKNILQDEIGDAVDEIFHVVDCHQINEWDDALELEIPDRMCEE